MIQLATFDDATFKNKSNRIGIPEPIRIQHVVKAPLSANFLLPSTNNINTKPWSIFLITKKTHCGDVVFAPLKTVQKVVSIMLYQFFYNGCLGHNDSFSEEEM